MTRRLLLPGVAVLAATLLAASCGGAGESAPVATTEVKMVKSYRFDPETIEIRAGETVTWANEDNFTHTVEVEGQGDHKVGRGESVSITFDEPGTYDYVCTLHRHDMSGTVMVK
jgi:plastocyanin